jgi:WD40 repeat protein
VGRCFYRGAISVACSLKYDRAVSGSEDGALRIWDIRRGTLLLTLKGHTAPISDLVFSPNGPYVTSGSNDMTMRVWDVTNGEMLSVWHSAAEGLPKDSASIMSASWRSHCFRV